MKDLLIVINHMNIGGIQKSLLELLKVLAKREDLSVSLFCCNPCGEFLARIPQNISQLPANRWAAVSEMATGECKKLGKKYYLFRVLASLWTKVWNKELPARVLCRKIGFLGTYDIAISYSQPIHEKAFCTLTNEIVLNCCSAKRKVTFLHCDYAHYGGNTPANRKLYQKFDGIAAVSDSVGKVLGSCIPEVLEKIGTVYNFSDKEEIFALAAQNPVAYSRKTLVTVARLSEEKGLLRCVPIMQKLKSRGLDFEWHIVGGGGQKTALEALIREYALEDCVVLEGAQENPYRYMKNADYLFLPSFHEAAPVVFDEAFALQLPVLTTDTLSAKELVLDRDAGLVCENNESAIYDMLYAALTNSEKNFFEKEQTENRNMERFKNVCEGAGTENE